mmetsp:Transcript_40364/g.116597  ORF Transcript_40364/g.116597 Transcript_40364/m.116597 type:complete len:232 (+) Transcript_40364:640-1335(+)
MARLKRTGPRRRPPRGRRRSGRGWRSRRRRREVKSLLKKALPMALNHRRRISSCSTPQKRRQWKTGTSKMVPQLRAGKEEQRMAGQRRRWQRILQQRTLPVSRVSRLKTRKWWTPATTQWQMKRSGLLEEERQRSRMPVRTNTSWLSSRRISRSRSSSTPGTGRMDWQKRAGPRSSSQRLLRSTPLGGIHVATSSQLPLPSHPRVQRQAAAPVDMCRPESTAPPEWPSFHP